MREKKKLKVKSQILGIFSYILAFPAIATAQIIPDATLPVNSNVTLQDNTFTIEGGTTAGNNLFHSFQQFSVPTNGTAFFNNAETIQNVFSRVTGRSLSNIDGLIQANGTANLFLINPNGIIFGPNASLNIGGSFLASTADSILFQDNSHFSATNPQAPPLLIINVPIGLQFGSNPGQIINRSQANTDRLPNSIGSYQTGLKVPDGKALALVGGNIFLEGGNITALGGQIDLLSVAGSNLVRLTPINNGWVFGLEGVQGFNDIRISQEAVVDTGGFYTVPPTDSDSAIEAVPVNGGKSGTIQLRSYNLTIADSHITTTNYGLETGGDLTVTADFIDISGTLADPLYPPDGQLAGGLFTQTFDAGTSGNLTVNAKELIVRNGAQISSGTFSSGQGGTLTVNASESVTILGSTSDGSISSGLSSQTEGSGNGGDLNITTQRLSVLDGAGISSGTFDTGLAGNLSIKASESVIVSGGVIDYTQENPSFFPSLITTQGVGGGGDLTLETPALTVQDSAQISAATGGEQSGGNILVNTEQLRLQNGGQISALTIGQGTGGTLTINASESIDIVGIGSDGSPSGLFTQSITGGEMNSYRLGNAGDLTVATQRLTLKDGGAISADTDLDGQGGSIFINASDSVELSGVSSVTVDEYFSPAVRDGRLPSRITAITQGIGDAGSLSINTGELRVQDGATVALDAGLRGGSAGNLNVQADQIRLLNEGAITAETEFGEGGNIQLESPDIRLRQNSQISTTAGRENLPGNGGNITIRTDTIVGLENSDIYSNAFEGRGGVVDIETQGILGFEPKTREDLEDLLNSSDISEFNPRNLSSNDITAVSRTNPSLSGVVSIQTPDVDPTQGLIQLPQDFAPAPLPQGCFTVGGSKSNRFVITGLGGVPPSPTDALNSHVFWDDLRPLETVQRSISVNPRQTARTTPEEIVEATGWSVNNRGQVVLIAQKPNASAEMLWQAPVGCPPVN